MKKILFAAFLFLFLLAAGVQIAAVSDSKKAAVPVPAKKVVKASTPLDLVYYRNIFFTNKEGC